MSNFKVVASKNGGDPVIEPVEGYKTTVSYLLIYRGGDALFYDKQRFEIAVEHPSDLRSEGRFAGLSDKEISLVSRITRIPERDLKEIRELERALDVPPLPTSPLDFERFQWHLKREYS